MQEELCIFLNRILTVLKRWWLHTTRGSVTRQKVSSKFPYISASSFIWRSLVCNLGINRYINITVWAYFQIVPDWMPNRFERASTLMIRLPWRFCHWHLDILIFVFSPWCIMKMTLWFFTTPNLSRVLINKSCICIIIWLSYIRTTSWQIRLSRTEACLSSAAIHCFGSIAMKATNEKGSLKPPV